MGQMTGRPSAGERLDSWKDISAYLGRDVSTVIRWEKEKGLPIHRIPGGQRQSVFAYKAELDAWLAGKREPNNKEPIPDNHRELNQNNGEGSSQVPEIIAPGDPEASVAIPIDAEPPVPHLVKVPKLKRAFYTGVGFVAALLLVAAYRYVNSQITLQPPQLIGEEQLTSNGLEKKGLLTDGKTVYFGQERDGWYGLAAMPVSGGPISVLWSPPANVTPLDISSDGQKLLALAGLEFQKDRELWVVPLNGGKPYRVSNVVAHSAAWAPDGKTIAYAARAEVYLISENKSVPERIASFDAFPNALHWGSDGKALYLTLQDIPTGKARFWVRLADAGMRTVLLRPPPDSIRWDTEFTPAGDPDTYFIAESRPHNVATPVWKVKFGTRWWQPLIQLALLRFVQGHIEGIAYDTKTSQLLVLSTQLERAAFVSFDPRVREFRPVLPGASGTFLNYSRDGTRVAYVSLHDYTLVVGRPDGTEARQLTFPPELAELPRWSPDGRQIAYMSKRPDSPWRIRVVDLQNGTIREASQGDDRQGAPTWSPDGKFIAYGEVECLKARSCSVHRIDLATGEVGTLPDSDGLMTARWSPDGRFIAAMNQEQNKVMLFDVKAGKWRKLADAIPGPDLSWSADSNYLYANIPGTDARIVRIRISDGSRETMFEFRSQDKFDLADSEDTQFSVAPDDSIVLHHRILSEEVYAYDLGEY
jgi:Tol biopolymer transport system component